MSQTVVYISNESVSVVKADVRRDVIRIEDSFTIPLNEGTMLNGVIIDEAALIESLKELKNHSVNEAALIVDSAKILAKTATVPKMKEQEIIQFVQDELSSVEGDNQTDVLYDFAFLKEDEEVKGASHILCVGVERQFVESYIHIFEEIDIKLTAIDYAVNVLISLVKELPGFIDKTFAINQIDGQNMVSVLFINNEYALTNRTRLFAVKGTRDYEDEIVGVVSQLKQFASSSSHEQPLSDLYFFGIHSDNIQSILDRIQISSNINVSNLPNSKSIYSVNNSEFDLNDFVYCIGYLKRK